ncbi:MAG: DNA primase [Desulfobacterales bacterium]|nr:DNA primase [Desulfobacterales bacterium]
MRSSPAQQDAVRQVKEAAQIVDIIGEVVELKRAGANLKGLCPFHAEKTPSFMVSPARQSFHCFGCNEGGDVFSFLMQYHRMTFPEALKTLAERYQITLPEREYSPADQARARKREILYQANERAASIYQEFLRSDPAAEPARAYLEKRGIPGEIIDSFRLGYAPPGWDFLSKKIVSSGFAPELAEEAGLIVRKPQGGAYDRFRDRVLFPISDLTGRVVGFGGRILGPGNPKYLNSPETLIYDKGRTLFGLFQHKEQIRRTRRCLIVEGNFDLLALAAHGVEYVVAPLGTALTRAQIRILKGFADELILLFDGDSAGVKAALRAAPLFLAEQVTARIAMLPAEHDPDTFVRAHGREYLENFLNQAQGLLEFVFGRLVEKHGQDLEGKFRVLAELRPLLEATADNPLQRSVLVSHFSDKLKLDPEQVERGFRAAARAETRGPARPPAEKGAEGPMTLSRVQRQMLEFLVLYPCFLPRFLEQGLEEILAEPGARTLLAALQELVAAAPDPNPEQLLDVLPAGPERAFVTSLFTSGRVYSDPEEDDDGKAMAEDHLRWLRRIGLEREIRSLSEATEEARKAGDQELILQLSARKVELNQALEKNVVSD